MALYARPVRVRPAGGLGISYGPTFRTTRPSRIATLPLGYGDGWSRLLSNRAAAIVRGIRVPLVGNVAMDAIMADVTDVPGPPVTVADEFVLLGRSGDERITVADLALVRTTNSWEVVTGMARMATLVYHAAAGPVGLTGRSPSGEPSGANRIWNGDICDLGWARSWCRHRCSGCRPAGRRDQARRQGTRSSSRPSVRLLSTPARPS
jgi:hypothetical protein